MFNIFKKKQSIDELEVLVKRAREEAVEIAVRSGNLKALTDEMLMRLAKNKEVHSDG